jgi:hypothetical protein
MSLKFFLFSPQLKKITEKIIEQKINLIKQNFQLAN